MVRTFMTLLTLSVFLLAVAHLAAEQSSRPNILLITADDLGNQLSCYGDKLLRPELFCRDSPALSVRCL